MSQSSCLWRKKNFLNRRKVNFIIKGVLYKYWKTNCKDWAWEKKKTECANSVDHYDMMGHMTHLIWIYTGAHIYFQLCSVEMVNCQLSS